MDQVVDLALLPPLPMRDEQPLSEPRPLHREGALALHNEQDLRRTNEPDDEANERPPFIIPPNDQGAPDQHSSAHAKRDSQS
jgi:hypothetical protein